MKTTAQLPDLAKTFGRLKTMIELEQRVNANTIIGHAIKKAFIDKRPYLEIVKMIIDQLQDNRKAVENCIPPYIVRSIETYWPEVQPSDDLKNINI